MAGVLSSPRIENLVAGTFDVYITDSIADFGVVGIITRDLGTPSIEQLVQGQDATGTIVPAIVVLEPPAGEYLVGKFDVAELPGSGPVRIWLLGVAIDWQSVTNTVGPIILDPAANKRVWVRAVSASGTSIASTYVLQPTVESYVGSGGFLTGGAATTSLVMGPNKKAWVRATNANGATISSVSFYQDPVSVYAYTGSGGVALAGQGTVSMQHGPNKRVWVRAVNSAGAVVASSATFYQPNDTFQVTLTSVNSTLSHRLQAWPQDLATGDIVEWSNVTGGVGADVTVNADGSWSALPDVTSFQFRIYSGGAWGASATQAIAT